MSYCSTKTAWVYLEGERWGRNNFRGGSGNGRAGVGIAVVDDSLNLKNNMFSVDLTNPDPTER